MVTVNTQVFGGSLGEVPWLQPSETASGIFTWRGFLRQSHQLGISFLRTPLTGMGCFSVVFWEKNIFWILFFQKQISCDLCTSFVVTKWRGPLGRFQLEAPRAYRCKWILSVTSVEVCEGILNFWPMTLAPMNGESMWLMEKISLEVKKCIQSDCDCHDEWSWLM